MHQIFEFATTVHGKCIIAGEHRLSHHCPSVVAPIHSKLMTLGYEESDQPIDVSCDARYEETLLIFFWSAIRHGLELLNKDIHAMRGQFLLKNDILMGADIGFPAALCVALSRWFVWKKWLKPEKIYDFACRLENYYHETGSRIDVAGVLSNDIIHFEKSYRLCEKIIMRWKPRLYISHFNDTETAAEMEEKIKNIRKKHRSIANHIDAEMQKSIQMVEEGLKRNQETGQKLLISGMTNVHHCFEKWQLLSADIDQQIADLNERGALAVVPISANGYLLSLWKDDPVHFDSSDMIPLFAKSTDIK